MPIVRVPVLPLYLPVFTVVSSHDWGCGAPDPCRSLYTWDTLPSMRATLSRPAWESLNAEIGSPSATVVEAVVSPRSEERAVYVRAVLVAWTPTLKPLNLVSSSRTALAMSRSLADMR